MSKHFHVKTNSLTHMQQYLNDCAEALIHLYPDEYFEKVIDVENGIFEVYKNGILITNAVDVPRKKYGTNGYTCLNIREMAETKEWADDIPDGDTYYGMHPIDDISEWVEPEE